MSQAVAAPNTGDGIVAPGKIGENVGRRSLLAGLALAPFALSVPALAVVSRDDPMVQSRKIDADFWVAYDRQKAIHVQWLRSFVTMRGSPRLDAVSEYWCKRHSEAECRMVTAPIRTLPALFAKLSEIKRHELDYHAAFESGLTSQDYILFDIERMMKSEYQA